MFLLLIPTVGGYKYYFNTVSSQNKAYSFRPPALASLFSFSSTFLYSSSSPLLSSALRLNSDFCSFSAEIQPMRNQHHLQLDIVSKEIEQNCSLTLSKNIFSIVSSTFFLFVVVASLSFFPAEAATTTTINDTLLPSLSPSPSPFSYFEYYNSLIELDQLNIRFLFGLILHWILWATSSRSVAFSWDMICIADVLIESTMRL